MVLEIQVCFYSNDIIIFAIFKYPICRICFLASKQKGFLLDIKPFLFVPTHHRPKLVVSVDKVDWETTGRPNDSSATVHRACPRAKTLFPRPHQQTKNRPAGPWERNGVCLEWRKTFHRSTWTKKHLAGLEVRHDSCARSKWINVWSKWSLSKKWQET